MQVTDKEIIELIDELIGTNTELKRKLLKLDADAIRSLVENNYPISDRERKKYISEGKQEELKKQEEKYLKTQKLYFLLLDEYYNNEVKKIQETQKISTK